MPWRSTWPERPRLLAGLAALLLSAQLGATEADLAQGRALFREGAQPPCSLCHSLRDAGASGAIGPNLDQLRPSAERVAAALRGGVGVMPSYAASLDAEQIAALAAYVSQAAGR